MEYLHTPTPAPTPALNPPPILAPTSAPTTAPALDRPMPRFLLMLPTCIFCMLAGVLGADAVANLSAASPSLQQLAKEDTVWIAFAEEARSRLRTRTNRQRPVEQVVSSFALRNYSHPMYRAFRWFRTDYSCVWRNWTFDLSRANGWSTDRRKRVWDHFMDQGLEVKVWYPLPKNYLPLWHRARYLPTFWYYMWNCDGGELAKFEDWGWA